MTGDCSSWVERPHTGTFSLAAALSVRVIELEEAAGQAALRPAPDIAWLDPGSDECAHTITLIHSTPYALLRGGRERRRRGEGRGGEGREGEGGREGGEGRREGGEERGRGGEGREGGRGGEERREGRVIGSGGRDG